MAGDSFFLRPGLNPVNIDDLQQSWADSHPMGPTPEAAGITPENLLDQFPQGPMPQGPIGPSPYPSSDSEGFGLGNSSSASEGDLQGPRQSEWQGAYPPAVYRPELQGPMLGLGPQGSAPQQGSQALGSLGLGQPPALPSAAALGLDQRMALMQQQGFAPGQPSGWGNALFHLGGALEGLGAGLRGEPARQYLAMLQQRAEQQRHQQDMFLRQYELAQRDQLRQEAISERLLNHYGKSLDILDSVPDESRAQVAEALARMGDSVVPNGGNLIRTIAEGGREGLVVAHELETASPGFINRVKAMPRSQQKKYLYSPEGRQELQRDIEQHAENMFAGVEQAFSKTSEGAAFMQQLQADRDAGHPMGEGEFRRLFRAEVAKPQYGIPEPNQRAMDQWLGSKAGQGRMAAMGVKLDEVAVREENRAVIDKSQQVRDERRFAHADAYQELNAQKQWDMLYARQDFRENQDLQYRIPADIKQALAEHKQLSLDQQRKLKGVLSDYQADLKLHAADRADMKVQESLVKGIQDHAYKLAFNPDRTGAPVDYEVYAQELSSATHAHPGLSDTSRQRLLDEAGRARQYSKPGASPGSKRTVEPVPGQAEIQRGQENWKRAFGQDGMAAAPPAGPALAQPITPAAPRNEPSDGQLPPIPKTAPKATPQAAMPPPKSQPTPAQIALYNQARAAGLSQAEARRKAGIH